MLDFSIFPKSDPTPMLRQRDGLYAVELLSAAVVHLNFFTWLNAHPSDLQTICDAHKLHPRPADVMMTLFRAMGLVVLDDQESVFRTTDLADEHMNSGSNWDLSPYFASMKNRPVCTDIFEVLKSGKPSNWASDEDEEDWHRAMEDGRFARMFTAAMDCRGHFLSQTLARMLDIGDRKRLLDVAGGSGIYACAMTGLHPGISACLFEKPPVDRIARKLIDERGYADKVSVEAGDMFADRLPSNCDMHLWSNVLHDWDFPEVRELLKRSREALPPGGLIIVHDAFINDAKDGPYPVAAYSALLMCVTQGKCYATSEMRDLLEEAGFSRVAFAPTGGDRGVMTAVK